MVNYSLSLSLPPTLQVVNVSGLSVVVGLTSAADTLCPQVCMSTSVQQLRNSFDY